MKTNKLDMEVTPSTAQFICWHHEVLARCQFPSIGHHLLGCIRGFAYSLKLLSTLVSHGVNIVSSLRIISCITFIWYVSNIGEAESIRHSVYLQ